MELQLGLDVAKYASFLDTGRHSDFEIACQGHVFKVHEAIVCAKSEFFDKVCSSSFSEGVNARVNLDDDEPAIVARMILFMYIGTYREGYDISSDLSGQKQFSRVTDQFNSAVVARKAEVKEIWPS